MIITDHCCVQASRLGCFLKLQSCFVWGDRSWPITAHLGQDRKGYNGEVTIGHMEGGNTVSGLQSDVISLFSHRNNTLANNIKRSISEIDIQVLRIRYIFEWRPSKYGLAVLQSSAYTITCWAIKQTNKKCEPLTVWHLSLFVFNGLPCNYGQLRLREPARRKRTLVTSVWETRWGAGRRHKHGRRAFFFKKKSPILTSPNIPQINHAFLRVF